MYYINFLRRLLSLSLSRARVRALSPPPPSYLSRAHMHLTTTKPAVVKERRAVFSGRTEVVKIVVKTAELVLAYHYHEIARRQARGR